MKIRQTYGSAVVMVVIAMMIILPFLAYLQYTWLGQISEQEYERMKGNLQTAAFHCSMDFSREITDLMKSLRGTLTGSDATVQKVVRDRIITWKSASTYPAILSGEVTIVSFPESEQTVSIKINEETTILLYKNLSAIALPIKNRSHQFVCVSLNGNFISSTILPKVIETNFSSSARSEYDIVIANDKGNVIYSSVDSSKRRVFEKADIIEPFLNFPPVPPLSSMPPERPNIDRRHLNGERPPEPSERNPREYERDHNFPSLQEKMEFEEHEPRMREHGLFELRVKHREGSLEVVVNNSRLLNLGLGFGVLLLLGASIVFLLLSTYRARQLAQ